MSLQTRLQDDLNAARKAQDKHRTLLLSTTLSEIRNRRIELLRDLNDGDVADVIRKGIKKRRESAEVYTNGGRSELADRERAEIAMLEPYLPAELSDDVIRAAVVRAIELGATAVGGVMAAVMPELKGKADGARISAIVREELTRQG